VTTATQRRMSRRLFLIYFCSLGEMETFSRRREGCIAYLPEWPCGFMIGSRYQQTLHACFIKYDPPYAEYSLGSLLFLPWIQEAFESNGEQRISEIDVELEDASYQRANYAWHEGLFYIFAPNPEGLSIHSHRGRIIAAESDSFGTQRSATSSKYCRSSTTDSPANARAVNWIHGSISCSAKIRARNARSLARPRWKGMPGSSVSRYPGARSSSTTTRSAFAWSRLTVTFPM
jgi:hypothetical protein